MLRSVHIHIIGFGRGKISTMYQLFVLSILVPGPYLLELFFSKRWQVLSCQLPAEISNEIATQTLTQSEEISTQAST